MILRPYQERLVAAAIKQLKKHNNTLAVAATGAGKTIMLAETLRRLGGKQLILQHRQELVQQNMQKFKRVDPSASCGFWTADVKTFRANSTFGMVQSLVGHVEKMPAFDVICVDEAHHIAAPSFEKIIDKAQQLNPKLKIIGFTATPKRSDRKALRKYFNNVCDHITIKELVSLGFLVPPRAFVVSVGNTQEDLSKIKDSDFGEQTKVADVLNHDFVNKEVIRNWKEKASDRPTIIFASTIKHANDVKKSFNDAGIPTGLITGDMSSSERKAVLANLRTGFIKVLVNVMVLTEGFDFPPLSCVILLRKCSDKSAFIQMAGRGLRPVLPEEFPGMIKKDCLIIDFGTSILTHGDLMSNADLGKEKEETEKGEAKLKKCPEDYKHSLGPDGMARYKYPDSNNSKGCGAEVPAQTKTCPMCGFIFERLDIELDISQTQIDLTEFDILNASPFRYIDLYSSSRIMIACGLEAWAGIFSPDGETWHAIGHHEKKVHSLAVTGKLQAMAAADDFLRNFETGKTAKKTKRWLDDIASEKQVDLLNRFGYGVNITNRPSKYEAMCHINFKISQSKIENILGV